MQLFQRRQTEIILSHLAGGVPLALSWWQALRSAPSSAWQWQRVLARLCYVGIGPVYLLTFFSWTLVPAMVLVLVLELALFALLRRAPATALLNTAPAPTDP